MSTREGTPSPAGPNPRWASAGASGGGLAAVLLFASGIVGDVSPQAPVVSPSSVIASVLADSRQRILVASYLTMLGVFFLIAFLGYLRNRFRSAGGSRGWLVEVAFGGGLVSCAMFLLTAHITQSLTVLESYGSETEVAKALYVMDWNQYLLVEAIPLAALLGGLSMLGLIDRVIPRWLSWSGLAVTAVLLAPVLPGSGVMLALVWIASLSAYLVLNLRWQRTAVVAG